jgi:hypothetical protein
MHDPCDFCSIGRNVSAGTITNGFTTLSGGLPQVINTKDGARRTRRCARAAITTAAALVAAAALAGPASANLTAMSPNLNPFGFPAYYEDSSGLQVGLCIENPGCPASPAASDMVGPDGEAFYQLANATVTGSNGQSVTVDFNVEAAFLDADPQTFGRIQVTAKGLEPGETYTVDEPYGTINFTVDGNGNIGGRTRAAQREETDGTFAGTLTSSIGPFLRSTSAPAGYLGDGVTATTVTGGAVRNTMTVTGPGLPPAVTSTDPATGQTVIISPAGLTTDKFVVEGKMFDPNAPMPVPPTPVPPDFDGDGVIDSLDRCLAQVGPASNGGCPIVGSQPQPKPLGGAGTTPTTITQVITEPVAQVKGVTASSPLAVSRLSLARRISITRLRRQGLRASMRVQEGTNVVRIAIYKARNGRKTGRALFTATRTPTRSGLFRVTLRSSKLSKLHRGSYVMEVRAGRSAATLGSVRRASFTVTR